MTRSTGLLFCLEGAGASGLAIWLVAMVLFGCSAQQPRPVGSSEQPSIQGNERIRSFGQAKKRVYELFKDTARTFYCNCRYSKRTVDIADCGFSSIKHAKRGTRTEIEHVVPVHAFGRSFRSWREGHRKCVDKKGRRYRGRRCAKKVSERFRKMSADLYNLRPVVGSLNALRSHFRMGMIEGEERAFGQCDVEIDNGTFEPREAIRGDVARIYLYMEAAYPGHGIVGKKQKQLFEAWSRADPVSHIERELGDRIRRIQGNANPHLTHADRAE